MTDIDRFRRPEQLELFHPPGRLPEWMGFPAAVRETATQLLEQMFRDHRENRRCGRGEDGPHE